MNIKKNQHHIVMGTLKLGLCIFVLLTSFTFVAEACSTVQVDCYDSDGPQLQFGTKCELHFR